MIHVQTNTQDIHYQLEPTFTITFTSEADLCKFQQLLERALNCAPEFGKDWFELSDRLDKFLNPLG